MNCVLVVQEKNTKNAAVLISKPKFTLVKAKVCW
jgi:hypothetical protein